MAINGIDQELERRAHSISPDDPIHDWDEVALIISIKTGHSDRIFRCKGCPLERWVEA